MIAIALGRDEYCFRTGVYRGYLLEEGERDQQRGGEGDHDAYRWRRWPERAVGPHDGGGEGHCVQRREELKPVEPSGRLPRQERELRSSQRREGGRERARAFDSG